MLKEQIERLVAARFADTDYFLVEVKESPVKVAVFIDHAKFIKLSDCIELSKYLNSELGETLETKELEISSPGMEEPLRVKKQYLKNIGKEITVLLKDGIRKNGVLNAFDDDSIEINLPPSVLKIPFNSIKEIKKIYSLKEFKV